jgi:PAT family beta-lactamase induction signal transducer AmpG
MAVGARTALARTAVLISGAITITLGQRMGWPPVLAGVALLFVPLALVVLWSPEPEAPPPPPRTLREAVFGPLLDLFRRQGILPILGFLLFYKFGENLATALVRPFLIQKCYVPEDVGLATATIGLTFLISGTLIGGASTERFGLTRCLWIFGGMQDVGFLVLALVDHLTPGSPCAGGVVGAVLQPMSHRLAMYGAIALENLCQGLATGAFGVLLLRMTQRKFSATQYALFSSIFALGRTITGPIAGYFADALGWTPFFFVCTVASIPGLILLQQFAPLGGREPRLDALEPIEVRPFSKARFAATSLAAGVIGFAVALAVSASLTALKAARLNPGAGVDLGGALTRTLSPAAASEWIRLGGLGVVGLVIGAGAAAFVAARYGVRRERTA